MFVLTGSNQFELQEGMPDICTSESERTAYYKSYVDTYIEQDVRKLISASSEMQFRRFIELLALRTSQERDPQESCRCGGYAAEPGGLPGSY